MSKVVIYENVLGHSVHNGCYIAKLEQIMLGGAMVGGERRKCVWGRHKYAVTYTDIRACTQKNPAPV